MAIKAGEQAKKTGDFICTKCQGQMHVNQGDKVPKCTCGNETFEERRREPTTPGTRRGS
jgi:hypothetical protein